MLEEFKKFALRGNVVDLAVGVIIGVAFGAIVTSLVEDIIMPIIGAVTGGLDFSNYYLPLSSAVQDGACLRRRQEAGSRDRVRSVSDGRDQLRHRRLGAVPRDQGDEQAEAAGGCEGRCSPSSGNPRGREAAVGDQGPPGDGSGGRRY